MNITTANPTLERLSIEIKFAVGECIISWCQVETSLCALFADIIGTDSLTAIHIWDSMTSFHSKFKALNILMENRTPKDDAVSNVWPKLAIHINKKHSKRNEVAHSGIAEVNGKTVLIPYLSVIMNEPRQQFSAEEILKRAQSFSEVCKAVNWVILTLASQQGKFPATQIKLPDLIDQIQKRGDQAAQDVELSE